jgi:hypothetical protein
MVVLKRKLDRPSHAIGFAEPRHGVRSQGIGAYQEDGEGPVSDCGIQPPFIGVSAVSTRS